MIKTKFIKIPGSDSSMADCPVTQALWQKIMGNNPSYFKGDNHPVETVSWEDCQEFIKKLNNRQKKFVYRLPTEKEWGMCASSCDNQNIDKIAWSYEDSNNSTQEVKAKLPNKLGFYDMLGNVWEWCADADGSYRVIRGGGWGSNARNLRAGNRNYWRPSNRNGGVGFRLVRTAVP